MELPLDDKLLCDLSAYADGELAAADAQAFERRLAEHPHLNRQIELFRKLDQLTAELPVPQLSADKAAAAWQTITPYTVQLSAAERAAFARLDQAARDMTVPEVPATKMDQVWPRVAMRSIASDKGAPAPSISGDRWDKTWAEIERKIESHPKMRSVSGRMDAAEKVDFAGRAQRRKGWALIAVSAAAMLALALFVSNLMAPPEETEVALELPNVLDENYQLQVDYVAGQDQPVITFLRTAENADTWNWLPE